MPRSLSEASVKEKSLESSEMIRNLLMQYGISERFATLKLVAAETTLGCH